MKQFIITYAFTEGSEEAWQAEINTFISALKNDPELQGKITYRCMKSLKGPEYYHLATVADEEVGKLLGQRDFFKHYTEETERVAGGVVTVTPLELIASTD
jgi:hypothetical protein